MNKLMCRSTFCERDMLSNCVKRKADTWWLMMWSFFFLSRNERFRQIEIKTWNNYGEETWLSVRNVHLIKIGPKSLGHTRQVICKDKECNLGPVAGYLSWNDPELSCVFFLLACSLSKGIFNAVKKVLRLASAMECADDYNKIVFSGMPLR